MALVYKYQQLPRGDGSTYGAPCVVIYEQDAQGRLLEIVALVDSGAETALIPKPIADVLGLPLGEETTTEGIGGSARVRKTQFSFVVKKGREFYPLRIQAFVRMDDTAHFPVLLGRNGFFEQFDITFRQSEEKIILKKNAAVA